MKLRDLAEIHEFASMRAAILFPLFFDVLSDSFVGQEGL